jgi:hypothetical protein
MVQYNPTTSLITAYFVEYDRRGVYFWHFSSVLQYFISVLGSRPLTGIQEVPADQY